jgi:stage V sporulation protein G
MDGESKIEVSRIHKVEGDSKLKAFVDISLNGLFIKGLRVVEGENGLFLGMPRQKGKDGKWYDVAGAATREKYQEIADTVLTAYNGE